MTPSGAMGVTCKRCHVWFSGHDAYAAHPCLVRARDEAIVRIAVALERIAEHFAPINSPDA